MVPQGPLSFRILAHTILSGRGMRTRHKRTPSPRRRALELIAANPDGCTVAHLAAENIPADVLIDRVRTGLVIARNERLEDEDGAVETTRVWISEAGVKVLAARA